MFLFPSLSFHILQVSVSVVNNLQFLWEGVLHPFSINLPWVHHPNPAQNRNPAESVQGELLTSLHIFFILFFFLLLSSSFSYFLICLCHRPYEAVRVYCRCLAWFLLLGTLWMEVIGLEGRPMASAWTFCQNWRTLKAAWVSVLNVWKQTSFTPKTCNSQANLTRSWRVNLEKTDVSTWTQLHSVIHIIKTVLKYWMIMYNLNLKLSRPESPRFWKRASLGAKHVIHRCADLEEKPFCL